MGMWRWFDVQVVGAVVRWRTHRLDLAEAPHQRQEAYATLNSRIQRGFQQLEVNLSPVHILRTLAKSTALPAPPRPTSWMRTAANGLAVPSSGNTVTCFSMGKPLTPPVSLWRSLFESPPPQWHPEPLSSGRGTSTDAGLEPAMARIEMITRPISAAERADLQTRPPLSAGGIRA